MRLRFGIVLLVIAGVCLLTALPGSWYNVHVVGPNFMTAAHVPDPVGTEEIRELNGHWSLWDHEVTDEAFQVPPEVYDDPYFVDQYDEEGVRDPNANALEVYGNTAVMAVAAAGVLALAAFGAWNIARNDRYRTFTAASCVLAAVLLLGGCFYFGQELPDAMEADAAAVDEGAFGQTFEPYINTEGETPAYYDGFSGGYPNSDPAAREQLDFGPGAGWWMAGSSGILFVLAGAVLYGAPQYVPRPRPARAPAAVVRYVPVPQVQRARQGRSYPSRMPAVSERSTLGRRPRHRDVRSYRRR